MWRIDFQGSRIEAGESAKNLMQTNSSEIIVGGKEDSGHIWVLKPKGLVSELDVRARSIKDPA